MPYINEYYFAATSTYWTYPGWYRDDATRDYRAAKYSNWMNISEDYWVISRDPDGVRYATVVGSGGEASGFQVTESCRVRPTFNLTSSVRTSGGSGTQSDPYRIEL